MSGETGSSEHVGWCIRAAPALGREQYMGTIAVRRTVAVLSATLLAVVACYAVLARSAHAADKPVRHDSTTATPDGSHRTVIGSGVKYVRNADGSVTQVR